MYNTTREQQETYQNLGSPVLCTILMGQLWNIQCQGFTLLALKKIIVKFHSTL